MYKGSCLCDKVRFEIHGGIDSIVYCHCSLCRKAQGSAFATNGVVQRKDFRFVQGEGELTAFESSPGQHKLFCKHCGSPIISTNEARPEELRIRLGTIESPIEERPQAHIFVSSRADWDEICDDLPQYDGYEPGRNTNK
jgi:hypothetical protein